VSHAGDLLRLHGSFATSQHRDSTAILLTQIQNLTVAW